MEMRMVRASTIVAMLSMLLVGGMPAPSARAAELGPEQVKFFETHVRPLLVENCFSCHAEKKQKGGLRLDSRADLLKGGKNGPIFDATHPDASKLLAAIRYDEEDLQMPPDDRLTPDQVAVLTQWVRMGAPWPAEGKRIQAPLARSKKRIISDADRAFWSFQPVKAQAVPPVADQAWCRNPIDHFILAKLQAEGLKPAPQADRATLIRRLMFDLHGLPPTPEEVDAFVRDPSSTAYEDLVDRLLASPRYGEQWARHWLDLVRYAESDGFKQDAYRPNAWPYRDYVIKSFNTDKPYDRFVTEQLAGDEIAPNDPEVIVATGYLRAGQYEYNNSNPPAQWTQILDDVTDVTGDAMLGLSMGCARCHDHKFDPILQADYYRLRSFFAPMLPRNDLALATDAEKESHARAMAEWERKAAPVRVKLKAFEEPAIKKLETTAFKRFPEEIQAILNKPVAERTPYEEQIAQLAARQITSRADGVTLKLTGKDKDEYESLKKQRTELLAQRPKPLMDGLVVTDVGPVPPPVTIPGDPEHPIEPGYLRVLDTQPLEVPAIAPTETSTGRRTALAKWITQPGNGLTTRVIANRIWQSHFGRGIVATSSDYGRLGTPPTHPELLDWLAKRFVDDGWSFKKAHRLMLTSATYRQSAIRSTPEAAALKDPENRWLWKMNTRRLDAEQVRDAMLAASGELKEDAGGPSVEQTSPHRSVYTKQLRNTRDPLLDVFDAPEAFSSVPLRNVTTTATQSLFMINGDFPLKRSAALAGRLRQRVKSSDPEALVDAAFQIVYGRPPEPPELKAAVGFLKAHHQPAKPADSAPNGDAPITQTMPQRGGQAVVVRNANPADMLRLPETPPLVSTAFTVEAYVQLESVYDNASVRVIASQWDGENAHAGWSLGVTGEKSKYQPRNLILQVATKDGYEVVASDMRLDLHKAYYVAVAANLAGREGDRRHVLREGPDRHGRAAEDREGRPQADRVVRLRQPAGPRRPRRGDQGHAGMGRPDRRGARQQRVPQGHRHPLQRRRRRPGGPRPLDAQGTPRILPGQRRATKGSRAADFRRRRREIQVTVERIGGRRRADRFLPRAAELQRVPLRRLKWNARLSEPGCPQPGLDPSQTGLGTARLWKRFLFARRTRCRVTVVEGSGIHVRSTPHAPRAAPLDPRVAPRIPRTLRRWVRRAGDGEPSRKSRDRFGALGRPLTLAP